MTTRIEEQIRRAAAGFLNKYRREQGYCYKGEFKSTIQEHRFDLKGKCAGQYCKTRIRVNGVNWYFRWNLEAARKYTQDYLVNTVGHEVAHHIADTIHGTSCGHDKRWKAVMRDLGLEPARCHSYKLTPARRPRKFQWECPECHFRHEFTQRLITNIKKSNQVRRCGICRTRLDLKDIERKAA
jgi:predicted SprT family Zn-dependent metalloprotease